MVSTCTANSAHRFRKDDDATSHNETTVRVDTKGRIVIPIEVRKQLGLRPGSEVTVTATNGRAIIEPESDPEQLMCDLEAMIDEAVTNRDRRLDSR
ncbi:AbrB/MazE/SpoVT family DNA-binding domain-containing protein [Halocatena marina]|uniref:AbrB/MazE/SpoVT family DNA-binding domain-containing protein n=1 Tax=Halocatena marina TaxID=2934937 RepID=A0ABD5YP21_9EURY|nr:AbrB/MazE/SpoVT family DNA-binding domain-containing protein [Halocatena marina]